MREIFKCDCGTHLVSISYQIPDKTFDWDDLSIAIYDVYNDKGRKYKTPKLMADVAILDMHSPKELTKLMKFLQKSIDIRKKSKRKSTYKGTPFIMEGLNTGIKNIKKQEKKQWEKDKKRNAKLRKKK